MRINSDILDKLISEAKSSSRKRMNLDLRTSSKDSSQRMLNALEPDTVLPIHRHRLTSETVIVLRGVLKEIFYNDNGEITDVITLRAGGECSALQIPQGQWHTVEVLESGTVIFEAKDGAYAPLEDVDVLYV